MAKYQITVEFSNYGELRQYFRELAENIGFGTPVVGSNGEFKTEYGTTGTWETLESND